MPAATRARLERAAIELFDSDGFDAVTTAEIAAAAGVTQRTFFRHFPTKLDALFGDTPARTREFTLELYRQPPDLGLIDALIAAIAASAPDEALAALDRHRARILRGTPSLVGAVRAYEDELEGQFADWIAQRTRRPRADFDVAVLAAVLVAARRATVNHWRATDDGESLNELARRALAHVNALDHVST